MPHEEKEGLPLGASLLQGGWLQFAPLSGGGSERCFELGFSGPSGSQCASDEGGGRKLAAQEGWAGRGRVEHEKEEKPKRSRPQERLAVADADWEIRSLATKLDVPAAPVNSAALINWLMDSKYLGKSVKQPIAELDTFPAPSGIAEVSMRSDEVTSSCPITGQPDFYEVSISYAPNQLCIESKSLKLYLWGFRDKAMFAEAMTAEICDRVVKDIAPKYCRVTTIQKPRGGITIESVALFPPAR